MYEPRTVIFEFNDNAYLREIKEEICVIFFK